MVLNSVVSRILQFPLFSDWMINLSSRRGFNTSVVAVANKLARIVYAVLSKGQSYTENKVCHGQI